MFGAESIHLPIVFLEGILSFFSPCVIPLLPIYIGYLAGGASTKNEDGTVTYHRKTVMLHTLFFVLGISAVFFLLGFSFTALGSFFGAHRRGFTVAGGLIILALGLFQLGLFRLPFLQREKKFHLDLRGKEMTPATAFVMGFTFSFAWTPCVGPALSSVLILASNSSTALRGGMLILGYALGFVIPFLFLGLFTGQMLEFLKKRRHWLGAAVKVGGALLVIMGVLMVTGWINGINSFFGSLGTGGSGGVSAPSTSQSQPAQTEESSSQPGESAAPGGESAAQEESSSQAESSQDAASTRPDIVDFTLTDQYGNEHTLSDYKGKVVVLNFWTTWCTYCKKEMPDLEELYKSSGENGEDLVILGVANPRTDASPYNQDVSREEITQFLEEGGYTFPTVMDETGEVLQAYGVRSFPSTYFIDKEGRVMGYAPGLMSADLLKQVVDQLLAE